MSTTKKLLELLVKNPRMSNETLAKVLGLNVQKVQSQIDQLQKSGEIIGFKTVLNSNKKTNEVFAIVEVRLTTMRGKGFDETAERIARFPEVESVYLISGSHDLNVAVRGKSLQDVANFIHQKVAVLENVRGTSTHFLLKKYKEDGLIFSAQKGAERLAVSA